MPVPNEDQATYLNQSENDAYDVWNIEGVFSGYAVLSGGLVTAQGTPDGTVAVAAGTAKVGGAAVSWAGANVTVLSGAANPDGSVFQAADPTLARFSLITVNSSGQLGVLHGVGGALRSNNDGSYLVEFPSFVGKTFLSSVFIPPTFTTVAASMVRDKRQLKTDGDFVARVLTPAAISATQNNYAPAGLPTANVIRQATNDTTQRTWTGLDPTGHLDGKLLLVVALGPGPLALMNENAGSTAANRFALAVDIVIPVGRSVLIYYDVTSSRWRAVGGQTAATVNAVLLGTSAVAGTSNYFMRSDDTIAAFGGVTPTTIAFGDAASQGAGTFAAKDTHRHGAPVAPATGFVAIAKWGIL